MKLRTVLLTAVALAVPVGVALAAVPQVERQELMEQNGKDAKLLGAMVKGSTLYDAATAKKTLASIAADTKEFITLFPKGSETGHKTRAKPEIWTNRAGFEAKADALVKAVAAASDAADGGADAFKTAFNGVGQACQSCHEAFRGPDVD